MTKRRRAMPGPALRADSNATLQALFNEAVNDLLAKHSLPEFVDCD